MRMKNMSEKSIIEQIEKCWEPICSIKNDE